MNNHIIANELLRQARALERSANLYRIRSYRHAALVLQGMERPVEEIIKCRGRAGLAAIPGIGEHIAYSIDMLLRTGKFVRWPDRKSQGRPLEKVA